MKDTISEFGQKLERVLQSTVNPGVFARGSVYGRSSNVRSGIFQRRSVGILVASGIVHGTDTYEVEIACTVSPVAVITMECTCPYGEGCKHAVALGCVLAEFCRTEPAAMAQMLEEDLRIEFSAHDRARTPGVSQSRVPKQKLFSPQEYFIRLDAKLTPYLMRRDMYYMQASITEALSRKDVPLVTRALLEHIQKHTFDQQKHGDNRDLVQLSELITESGMIASFDHSYLIDPITFNKENAKKLEATITCREEEDPYTNTTYTRFNFEMPGRYWKGQHGAEYRSFFVCGTGHVAYIRGNVVTFYTLPRELGSLMGRVHALYVDTFGYRTGWARRHQTISYSTQLRGDEVAKIEEIIQLLQAHCIQNEPIPAWTVVARGVGVPSFEVDYHHDEKQCSICAVYVYGDMRVPVGEVVYISTAGGKKHAAHRSRYAEGYGERETHRIVKTGDTITIARIDYKGEQAFFSALYSITKDIGLTKKLSANYTGEQSLNRLFTTIWQPFVQFAEKQGYPIVFLHDVIRFEETDFKVHFNVDTETERDWLFFDVTCYCNKEKVILTDLITFIASGSTHMTRPDGTMVTVRNRDELERLVALIQSFEAREGGFQGKLHHSTELAYVLTLSEHYTNTQAKAFQNFMKGMRTGKPVKRVRLKKQYEILLRPYQKEGVSWLYFLREHRFAGILADDMGLGKTLQTIVVLDQERIEGVPSLVVCPTTLVSNWQREIAQFAPSLRTLVYEGPPSVRSALIGKFTEFDLIVVSYATLKQDESQFVRDDLHFNYVVLDEAQFIKNHATKSAQIAKRLNAEYRLALTGTPLENSVSELWSIFDFLMPRFLGNYTSFKERFHKPIMEEGDLRALEHLRSKVTPFMLRRTKGEVLKELPQKIEQDMYCELNADQNVLYQQVLSKLRREVFTTVEVKGYQNAHIHILAALTKLRQICNHPELLLDTKTKKHVGSAKLDLALELIEEAVEGNHPLLIFSQFTSMLAIIERALDERGIRSVKLTGESKKRSEIVDSFMNDESIQVFLISLKAGGTGLNLTRADSVIIFDPWWNPSVEAQAADRAHRIGQSKVVHVYRLITKGTIEEKIQALKVKKRTLSDAIVSENAALFKKLTWDDIKELFEG